MKPRDYHALTWLFLALVMVEIHDGPVSGIYTLVAVYITVWMVRRQIRRWKARRHVARLDGRRDTFQIDGPAPVSDGFIEGLRRAGASDAVLDAVEARNAAIRRRYHDAMLRDLQDDDEGSVQDGFRDRP